MEPHHLEVFLNLARQEALQRRNYYTTTEHLLFVLLKSKEITRALADLGAPVDFLLGQLERFFSKALETAKKSDRAEALAVPTDALRKIISQTVLQALNSGRQFPREIDFLILMASDKDSFAAALFRAVNIRAVDLMRWASEHQQPNAQTTPDAVSPDGGDIMLDEDGDGAGDEGGDEDEDDDGDGDGTAQNPDHENVSFQRIKAFVTKLVALAKSGKIDPVVGRDKEIDTCCQALLRRNKCNVLIVGETGVGKTAIVEGLARRIARGEVPGDLQGAEIYSVDIPSLMAGTKYRGEMEARLKSIIQYVKKRKNAILFIDELHSAAGADRSGGSQEILALLKPELAKGKVRLIGTTTYEDYRRALSADSALLRRFHQLDIIEPDEATTKLILHEIASHYESFHSVTYTPEAIDDAVRLSGRYLPEKRFPDKAIDIIDEAGAANRMLPLDEQRTVIDSPQIESIVANIARIPDLHVSQTEASRLKTAQDDMKKVIFGQDAAVEAVIRLVKLSRAGIRNPEKPVACFLFTGPTGVGKTEVAKQLAKTLLVPFVRFDMSEYREEYTISKFIGSAPGYVGYERGGLLTEAIRAKPNCVLLLDEIEKAHPSIYDLLLQVMDVARLTDNTGKTADFRQVILIMTSNAGSEEMSKTRIGFGAEIDVSAGMRDIEKTFSPEFRNRLDDIVMFNPLTPDAMGAIVSRMVNELEAQLAEKNISLELSDEARKWLAEKGFDPKFGARPMHRLIQTQVSVPLSEEILFGYAQNGGRIRIDVKSDQSGLDLKKVGD